MSKSFIVPVSWEVYSTVEVVASTYVEAVKIAEEKIDDIPLGNSEYIDGSYKIEYNYEEDDPQFKHFGGVSIDKDGHIWKD